MSTPRKPSPIFEALVTRPVALLVLFTTLIVVSVIAYSRVPIQLLPSGFAEPSLYAWIPNPGSSAQENEELVARPVEEQLRTISGIEELRSWSERDSVQFGISFSGSTDMNLAKAEVRDRIERAWPGLPTTVETAQIWSESSESLPITFFGIKLTGDPDRRDHLMDKIIVPRLEAVQGVGKVTVWGMNEDSVRILLDEDKVAAAGIDIGTVIRRLATDNFALPMGELEDGGRELIVRSDMRFTTPEEIAEFPVGKGLRVKDLGRVARVKEVRDQISRIDGGYAYFGMATKDSQSNVVETSENFRAALHELENDQNLTGQVAFLVFFLQGDMIQSALAQLKDTALEGGFLAVIVLLVFLRRLRMTLCVALSIPASALIAIAWEYFTGGTFNVLTMTGITLSTGMLVDNAVVVVENILRLRREGMSDREAASEGTREIALAVTLATLTSVVVFLPLVFLTEQAVLRVLFQSLVIPYTVALLASLVLALAFTPVIVARMPDERSSRAARLSSLAEPFASAVLESVRALFGAMRWAWFQVLRGLRAGVHVALAVLVPLRWPLALVVLAATAFAQMRGWSSFAAARAALGLSGGGAQALAETQASLVGQAVASGMALVLLLLAFPRMARHARLGPVRPARFRPQGASLVDMTVELNHVLLEWTLKKRLAAVGVSGLAMLSIALPMAATDMTAFGGDNSGDEIRFRVNLQGRFTMEEAERELLVYEQFLDEHRTDYGFAHWSNRFDEDGARFGLHFDARKSGEDFETLEKRLKAELPRISGHRLRFYDEDDSQNDTKNVARFTLLGTDSRELERIGMRAITLLESVRGLSEVSTPLEAAPDQIEVAVDRDVAQELGVTTASVENTIAYALGGFALPRFQEEGREVPLRIEFDDTETAGLPTLSDLSVFGDQGAVPLSSIGSVSFTKGSRSIFRRDGKTSFTLEGKVEDPLQILAVTAAGQRALQELDLPRGYSVDTSNSIVEQQEEEATELLKALMLGVFLIFLLMGILFESVLLPFSVLFTIPFAILGSYWTLFLLRMPLDSMGMIGMIILAGVVVNHGVVLIDRIYALRLAGYERNEAVLVGSRQRVRPVLMTALTTVVGLVPMILAQPPRDGFDYRSLATIVAGGLVASTFFTLWVVPLAYTLIDDLSQATGVRLRWWMRPREQRAPAAAEVVLVE
jgi:hydrophobic/amphiphilic exporter-1 (mainly G- bacteria), HAE1 family